MDFRRVDFFHSSPALNGVLSQRTANLAQSYGTSIGINLGYYFVPNFSARFFYNFALTANATGSAIINLVDTYGLEGNYIFNPEKSIRFLAGAKIGRLLSSSKQWYVIMPINVGSLDAWIYMDPRSVCTLILTVGLH